MKITVKYFAALKDERRISEEIIDSAENTPAEIYAELKSQHNFSFCPSKLKVAVNDEFAEWDVALNDGDVVVFIPPVAGG